MISITDPIQSAVTHTRRLLFEPFSARKWCVLGFAAFLAHLGGGGSYGLNGNPFDHASRSGGPDFNAVATWLAEHLALVLAVGVVLFGFILALSVLFLWLSSRGQFMFLDGVARDRAEIVEPWTRLRPLADQLFRFRLFLLLATLALFLICGGLGLLIALPDIHARAFGSPAAIALAVAFGILLPGLLAIGVVSLLLRDFVVPIMYRRDLGTAAAWSVLRRELLPGQVWRFVGFYLMTLLLAFGAALLFLLGCCLTCCVALIPYISSVLFLPVLVFFRAYPLCFLAQFGEEWRILEPPASDG